MEKTTTQLHRQQKTRQRVRTCTLAFNEYSETTVRSGSTKYASILINYCWDTQILRQDRLRKDKYIRTRTHTQRMKYPTLQTFNTMLQMRIKSTRQTCKHWTMLAYNLYNPEYISIESIELQIYRVTLILLKHYQTYRIVRKTEYKIFERDLLREMRLHYYYQVLYSILLCIHRPNKSKLSQGGDTERYNSPKEGNQEGTHTSKVRNTWSRVIQRIDRYRLTFYKIIMYFA